MFGRCDTLVFDTLDHDKHRMRREAWSPYFSRASVARVQPLLIQDCVNKLCERLADYQAAGRPVIMTYAYACLTANVISEYSFPQGYGFLNGGLDFNFHTEHYDAWMSVSKISHLFKQFGWLFPTLNALPLWYIKIFSIETYRLIREKQALDEDSKALVAR